MARWPQGGPILAILAAAAGIFALYSVYLAREAWIAGRIAALSGAPAGGHSCAGAESGLRRLYLIGDSTLARWPAKSFGAGWEVINCGIGGETAAQLARRFENFDFVRPQDAVLIAAGLNDLVAAAFFDGAKAKEIREQTTRGLTGLAHAASLRSRHVLLATLVPPSRPDLMRWLVWKESVRDLVAEANGALRGAKLDGRIEIVDFAAALDSADRRTPDIFRADTLHLNEAGYARLAEAVRRALPDP
ncbi:SGNH/GDSL hydrolase family protein [uncultured Rhodoblastus sp.]|uniref:SGNH/GDSL hydrolase family protein n=1 Tax=uncultured Rhodoblastus sp. TaxID=543037 RepID=UPI0025EEB672|nr:SGNH/GDSL hydrolase family protein [uncultured Rhodoblastus sp.]